MSYTQALKNVITLLETYQGEPIIKDEHPLHIAVQALEKHHRPPRPYCPQYRMNHPAHGQWVSLLNASRPNKPNHLPGEWKSNRQDPPDPELAIVWDIILHKTLTEWLQVELQTAEVS